MLKHHKMNKKNLLRKISLYCCMSVAWQIDFGDHANVKVGGFVQYCFVIFLRVKS